ncbi:MAG: hypothetical protein HQL15_07515 [Candidatus Omnitrophica bacterium]|nr:hypothetical protein [Candidatus Omnitrophota bacterium]
MSLFLYNSLVFFPLVIFSSALLFLVIYFWFILNNREAKIARLEKAHHKILISFDELDDQAKLIIQTDLKLNRAQEELEKRMNGLSALQKTSRQMNQALSEQEIFEKLTTSLFEDLGFSKSLVVITSAQHLPAEARTQTGFDTTKIKHILDKVSTDALLKITLNEGRTYSSINTPRKTKDLILEIFGTEYFVLAPIVTQTGPLGFLFVGNRTDAPAVTLGDEEIITILAGQIGQSLENAQLFDKVFRSSQELEVKVIERTKELATALKQVEIINRKKTEFLSAVSHELRTPLTSIKGYASLLITGKIGDIPDAVKERLKKINTHSDSLVHFINNLLDITRIESGKVEMAFKPYPTKNLVDTITDLLTPQVTAKDIQLTTVISTEVPDLYVDPSQVERILINLLSNAIKFTPKGGSILLSAAPFLEHGFVKFDVTDSGIGIPPSDVEKLFTEFFRVDNEINQNVKGTGLGLVLAKDIVLAHHGKIWVTSVPGHGTTFSFTLPASKETFEYTPPSTDVS